MNLWYKCNLYLHLYLKCISKVVDHITDIWKKVIVDELITARCYDLRTKYVGISQRFTH